MGKRAIYNSKDNIDAVVKSVSQVLTSSTYIVPVSTEVLRGKEFYVTNNTTNVVYITPSSSGLTGTIGSLVILKGQTTGTFVYPSWQTLYIKTGVTSTQPIVYTIIE